MTGTDSTLVYRPASELARAIASGELRSEMLVERFLDRIERLDTKLHAFIDVYADDARSAAGAADRAIAAGHGTVRPGCTHARARRRRIRMRQPRRDRCPGELYPAGRLPARGSSVGVPGCAPQLPTWSW